MISLLAGLGSGSARDGARQHRSAIWFRSTNKDCSCFMYYVDENDRIGGKLGTRNNKYRKSYTT